MTLALAYVSSVLALLFGASLLDQYLAMRRPHHLLWAVALALFSMAMGLWFLRETMGLNQWMFRLWYLSGGMLAAAYVGTGVLYMMAPRRVANAFMGYLLVVTVASVVLVLTAQIQTPDDCAQGFKGLECLLTTESLTKMGFFPPWIRVLAVVLNVYGGLAVVAGAVWSVLLLVRKETPHIEEPSAQAGDVASPGEADRQGTISLSGAYPRTLFVTKVLWHNRNFWRRDQTAQRAGSNLVLTIGVVLGALGLTLNNLEGSDAHLGFFLAAVIFIYAGFLDVGRVYEALARFQPREFIQALRAKGPVAPPVPEQLQGWETYMRRPGEDAE